MSPDEKALAPTVSTSLMPPGQDMEIQMRTAMATPRDLKAALAEAVSLVSDPMIARSCWYALERKDRHGRKVTIIGPSVRLAEIVAYSWRNVRFSGQIVEVTREHVIAEGVAFDLERNNASRVQVRRAIIGASGRYSEEMISVTSNAAVSIAIRNALFRIVPGAFVSRVLEAAREAAKPRSGSDLKEHVAKGMAFFQSQGVKDMDVLEKLDRQGVSEINAEDLETMRGWANLIRDGDAKPETIFGHEEADVAAAEELSRPSAAEPVAEPSAEWDREAVAELQRQEATKKRKGNKIPLFDHIEAVNRARILAGEQLFGRASPHAIAATTDEQGITDWQAFLTIFQTKDTIVEAACKDKDPVGAMRQIAAAQAKAQGRA